MTEQHMPERDERGQFLSDYTPELGQHICAEMADGKSLRTVCKQEGMPDKKTVMRWLQSYPEFEKIYRLAQQARAEMWMEEVIDICDDSSNDYIEQELENGKTITVVDHEHIQRSRLRVDTRKWIATKQLPKLYGDKVGVTHEAGDNLAALLQAIDGKSRALPDRSVE